MSPTFFFRLDETRESQDAPVYVDKRADWAPSALPNANIRVEAGATGKWWYCDGQTIRAVDHLPPETQFHQTYSMYYLGGFGFWVLQGDAILPGAAATWHPLRFDHDREDGYSSFLCNSAQYSTVASRRADQQWLRMLLPDIYYHSTPVTPYSQYGALKGELAIFLALMAFAMKPDRLQHDLPSMFENGEWQVRNMQHGREDRRGVVAYVYTWYTAESKEALRAYENGSLGKYYH